MLYETKFLIALLLTVVIEVPIVIILSRLLRIKNKLSKIIFVAVIASALTIPYLWFIFPVFLNAAYYVYIGEIIVFLVEAFVYYFLLEIKFWKAILISLIANLLSFLVGIILIQFGFLA